MLSLIIRLSLTCLVLNQLMLPSVALKNSSIRGSGGKYGKEGLNSKDPSKPKSFVGTSPGLPSQNASRRGLGVSAWGIVTIVVMLALAGMGFYYFSMCYPILCKKERKYDMIKLDNV